MLALGLVIATLTDPWARLDLDKFSSQDLAVSCPAPTDGWKAEIRLRLAGPTDDDPILTETWSETAEVVKSNPLQIKFKRTLKSSTIDGQSVPPPDGDALEWIETLALDPKREPALDEPTLSRYARITAFTHPSQPEMTWPALAESRVPPAVSLFRPAAKFVYTYRGHRCSRSTWTFEEKPGTRAKGEALFDQKSGVPIYTFLEGSGVHLPGGDGTQFKLTWIRELVP